MQVGRVGFSLGLNSLTNPDEAQLLWLARSG